MWFIDFFFDIFNIVMILIFVLVGILIGVLVHRHFMKPKNQVLYCRERDGRGLEFNINEEGPFALETATNPALRFWKWGRSYDFFKRGRAYSRFFGKEGTAYTWVLEGFHRVATKFKKVKKLIKEGTEETDFVPETEDVKAPIEWADKEITVEFPTLEDAIKATVGEKEYEIFPDKLKDKFREDKVLVTVGLEPGITPEGYTAITETIIEREGDKDMANLIAKGVKGSLKTDMIRDIALIFAGMGGMALISKLFGWW